MSGVRQEIVLSTGLASQETLEQSLNATLVQSLNAQPAQICVDEEIVKITRKLASHQVSKPLGKASRESQARQQVHESGTSELKVRKNPFYKWTAKKQKTKRKEKPAKSKSDLTVEEKALRKEAIKLRRTKRRESLLEQFIDYEGFLDMTHKVVLEVPCVDKFIETCKKMMDSLREFINRNKKALEVVITMEAGETVKMLTCLVCALACAAFAFHFVSTVSFLSFVGAALAALGTLWVVHKDVFQYVTDELWFKMGGKHRLSKMTGLNTEEKTLLQVKLEAFLRRHGQNPDGTPYEGDREEEDEKFHDPEEFGDFAEYEGVLDHGTFGIWMVLGDIVQSLGGVLCGVVGIGRKRNFVQGVANAPRTVAGIKIVLESVLKFFAGVCDNAFGTEFMEILTENKALDKWVDDVMTLAAKYPKGELELSTANARRVHNLVQRGRQIAVDEKSMSYGAWQLHRMAMSQLDKLEVIYNQTGMTSASRPVPLGICLQGASGSGKSYVTAPVLRALAAHVMPKEQLDAFQEQPQSEIWTYCSEEEHANGYKGQWAVVIDDLGQQKAAPGQKTDALAVVRFINQNPCPLNMAELHNKGNVNFSSSVIMCSTNKFKFWDMNIVEPEAFIRRISVWVEYFPKKEYCTDKTMDCEPKDRRLDPEKAGEGWNPNVGVFRLLKIADAKQQTWEFQEDMDFPTFVKHLAQLYKGTHKQHEQYAEDLKKLVSDIREEKGMFYEGWLDWFKSSKEEPEPGTIDPESVQEESMVDYLRRQKQIYVDWTKTKMESLAVEAGTGQFRSMAILLGLLFGALGAIVVFLHWLFGEAKREEQDLTGLPAANKMIVNFDRMSKDFRYMQPHERTVHPNARSFLDAFLKEAGTGVKEPKRDGKKLAKQAKALQQKVDASSHTHLDMGRHRLRRSDLPDIVEYHAELFSDERSPSLFGPTFVASFLKRNVYHMYTANQDTGEDDSKGKVTMLTGRIGMLNAHYITQMKRMREAGKISDEDQMILVRHGDPTKQVAVPYSNFFDEERTVIDYDRDLALVEFGDFMQNARNIVDFFVDELSYGRNRDFNVSIVAPRAPTSLMIHEVDSRCVDKPITVGEHTHRHTVFYKARTREGDCGSLLYLNTNEPKKRLFGIHMAGSESGDSKIGYGTIVTCDYLKKQISKLQPQIERKYADIEADIVIKHESRMDVVDVLPVRAVQPSKSAYIKSPMYGAVSEPTKDLALLAPFKAPDGTVKSPLHLAHKKQMTVNVTTNEQDVEAAVLSVVKLLKPCIRNKNRLLTFREAVEGTKDLTNLKPIPRSKSAGVSALYRPSLFNPGKTAAFGHEGDFVFDTPGAKFVEREVASTLETCKQGIDPGFISIDTLKDEKLPLEKVSIGKTRIIRANDIVATVVTRMLFGAVASDLVDNKIFNGIAVGINPYSKDWEHLVKHITCLGPHVVAGDFSGYDNSQSCQLLTAVIRVLKILCAFEDPQLNTAIDAVGVSLSQPRYLTGTKVYEQDHGLPSGNPLTSIMNSIFGLIAFRLVWLDCTRHMYPTRTLSMRGFEDNVRVEMYGDDNILNIAENVIDVFNQKTIMAHAPSKGLIYTCEDKTNLNPPAFRKITEISFLKREFRYEPALDRIVAPLDLDTVLEMSYFTKRGGSELSITTDNVVNSLRELSLHGREVYNAYAQKLVSAAAELYGADIPLLSWASQIAEVQQYSPPWMSEHF